MKKRNFNTIMKDIKAHVTKNSETSPPDIYGIEAEKNNEEEYCPADINFDELSSSE
jgi:hypothetical protein